MIKKDKSEVEANLSFAEQFIEYRDSGKVTDDTTMDEFLDAIKVPEDLRSDFMVAAMFKQVQDIDISNGNLEIKDSYRASEIQSEIPVIPQEDIPLEVQRERAILEADERLAIERDEYINGGPKVSFFRGMWNLLVDGKWNPERALRKKVYNDNPIQIDALRLMKFKDIIIDVPNVSAIFYREQDSKMVILVTGRVGITRTAELAEYQDLLYKFMAVIRVMNTMFGDKYSLNNYILHDKCLIKKNRILCSEFKRSPGLAIVELKGGSHVNIRSTRNKYNELQGLILKGHYDA